MTQVKSFEKRYASSLLLLVVLALFWVGVTEALTPLNFLVGLGIAWVVLLITVPSAESALVNLLQKIVTKSIALVRFGLFFAYELLTANLRMAADIIRPRMLMRPGILAIPLDVTRDGEITLLANMITLTPGTLSLDVSPDRRTLYVHVVNTRNDPESVRRTIKEAYERRVMEVLR